jgi:hypothetical protein
MNDKNHTQDVGLEAIINVSVEVTYAAEGMLGNTASGKYVFTLSEDVVHVQAQGIITRVRYTLTDGTLDRGFSFTAAYVSDPKFQLTGPYVICINKNNPHNPQALPDTIEVCHSNTHASLISISLQVKNSNTPEKLIAYDPEMTNEPGN